MGLTSVPARKVSKEMAKIAMVINYLTQDSAMMVFGLHCKLTIGNLATVKPKLVCRENQLRPWQLMQRTNHRVQKKVGENMALVFVARLAGLRAGNRKRQ